jgi:hypothetical protein
VLGQAARNADQIRPPTTVTPIPPITESRSRQLADLKSGSNSRFSSQYSSSMTVDSLGQSRSTTRTPSQASTSRTTVSDQDHYKQPYSSSDMIRIKISGLRNKISYHNQGLATFSEIVQVPANAPLERVGAVLKEKLPSKDALRRTCNR